MRPRVFCSDHTVGMLKNATLALVSTVVFSGCNAFTQNLRGLTGKVASTVSSSSTSSPATPIASTPDVPAAQPTAAPSASVAATATPASKKLVSGNFYQYIVMDYDNSMSSFLMNSDGTLQSLGGGASKITIPEKTLNRFAFMPSPSPTSSPVQFQAKAQAVNAVAQFAYATAPDSLSIDQFTVGLDGTLTPNKNGKSISTIDPLNDIFVDPSGQFVYAGSGTNNVYAFAIQPDGTLQPAGAGTYTSGNGSDFIALTPDGKYLYNSNTVDGTITIFSINSSDGSLTSLGTKTTTPSPGRLKVEPTSTFLYQLDTKSNVIVAYKIGVNGSLTALPGKPTATGQSPYDLVIDDTGTYVYVSNAGAGSITTFSISRNGTLIAGTNAPAGKNPRNLLTYGSYVYCANTDDAAYLYSIGVSGGLTPLSTPTLKIGQAPIIGMDATGTNFYTFTGGQISLDTIDPKTGIPSASTNSGSYALGSNPAFVATDPAQQFLYVTNSGDNTVSMFSINSDGSLSVTGSGVASTDTNPNEIVATSQYVYTVNAGSSDISMFQIDTSGGTTGYVGNLIPNGTVPTGTSPYGLIATPNEQFLYVANQSDNTISMFAIQGDGTLQPIGLGTVATGKSPYALVVDPTGSFLYASNMTDNTISMFSIDGTGNLTPIQSGTIAANGVSPIALAIDPSGQYLYSSNSSDGSIGMFALQGDGSLLPIQGGSISVPGTYFSTLNFDPNGLFLYGGDLNNGAINAFTIQSDGSLMATSAGTSLGTINGPEGAVSVAK